MDLRNISAWSIRNPIVPIVLFTGLVILGIISFIRMDVQQDPDVEFPMVIVQISQPGASPTEIENQISQRVESAVRTLNGVETISSTANEGSSETAVEFEIGEDINEAVNEVKNAVDQVRGELPDGILEPRIFKVNSSQDPIAYFAVEADDMTLEQLSWFIDDTIAKRLLAVEGMAEVTRIGGVDREILVTLDPARMQALGVTAAQVNIALRSMNINSGGGKTEIGGQRQSVRVLGNARNAFELSQSEIALPGEKRVKLADIGTVADTYSEIVSKSKFNRRPVVMFSISRARGASDVTAYDGVAEQLQDIEKTYPGVRFIQAFGSVGYTKDQYESSIAAMVEGAILAVIVVFFFLRDWRATIISAIAIPLSAIPTFWVIESWFGFTLNQLSLLALSLVAGVLVDDAIVEIENIVRHMRMGKTPYQAAIDAADEIGLAVVATTFSIVAVFLPVGLMPGVSGEFFKNFGLTVVVAVLMSLAIARLITPMVAAYFLESHGHAEHAGGPWMDRYVRVLHWSLDTSKAAALKRERIALNGRLSWRDRIAARLRDHRIWLMGIGMAALALTGLIVSLMPSQFFPEQDSDFSRIVIEMTPGTTLAETEKVVGQVAEIVHDMPEAGGVVQRIEEGRGRVLINFRDDRERTSMEIEQAITKRLQQIPDARATVSSFQNAQTGTGRPISVMLTGSDSALLDQTAAKLTEEMKALPQIIAPRVSADLRRPEVIVTPRLDLAAELGVSTADLSQAIRIATLGEIDQNAAKFSLSDRQVPIRVRLPEDARRDYANIENLPIPTRSGGSVPLSRVAEITYGSGPTTIQRYNQQRRIFVGADMAPGVVKSDADKAIAALPTMKNLPRGVSNEAFGSDAWQAEMMGNFMVALAAGVLLVFSVLVLLYHRVISPLVNMGSLFLAPLGGLIALVIAGQPLSLPVFIGLLMLFGIVAKNSILLIDFAIEEMARGVPKFEAIVDAGRKRAQPIVMTTVAMVAGMIPTAMSLSGDSAWRAPMGTVVIGGLTLSTVLTLLIVPAAFSLADGLEKRLGPGLRRRFLTYDPDHGRVAVMPAERVGARGQARPLDEEGFPAE